MAERAMADAGLKKAEYKRLMKYYRAVRDNRRPPKYRPAAQTIDNLIKLLGDLISHARKEEKGR